MLQRYKKYVSLHNTIIVIDIRFSLDFIIFLKIEKGNDYKLSRFI